MEYVENGNLQDFFDFTKTQKITLSQREMISTYFCYQIILTLDELHHRLKISHRDIKPENICISKDNKVIVIDFGIAALNPASYEYNSSFTGVN